MKMIYEDHRVPAIQQFHREHENRVHAAAQVEGIVAEFHDRYDSDLLFRLKVQQAASVAHIHLDVPLDDREIMALELAAGVALLIAERSAATLE